MHLRRLVPVEKGRTEAGGADAGRGSAALEPNMRAFGRTIQGALIKVCLWQAGRGWACPAGGGNLTSLGTIVSEFLPSYLNYFLL